MNVAARGEFVGKHRDEVRAHEAALVVTGLTPGIGKEDVDAGQRSVRNHVAHDFHRVMAADAHVREPLFLEKLT